MNASAFGEWTAAARRLRVLARRSDFIRRQLSASGLSARAAGADPDAWRRIRPATKQDMLDDQALAPPFGTRRCVPTEALGLVTESSGSTGRGNETHYLSWRDLARMRRVYASYLAELGIGAQDLVALTLPVGMAGGGVKLMQACEALGAAVLRVGSLPTRKKVEAMRHYRTSALIATPAYVDRLGQAAEESGILPRDLGVRRILVATQSVTTDWIESTQEAWGASLFEWYGTSSGLAAFSCRAGMLASSGRRGTLHWNPVFAFQEVVDRKGGGWIEGGQRGELIGTPLQVEAEALLRIQSGDEVEFRPPGSCACGSEWPGIESGTVRRLDDMLKVKGVNLVPASVEAVLFGLDGVRDYRARVFQDRARREVVRVEVLAPAAAPGLALRLQERLTEATGLIFDVAVLDDDARWTADTPGEVVKVRRWIDERVGQ